MILVENLKKSFGHKAVLKDVSFEVKKGQSLVIMGASGSGKSVTLKCLLGLMHADAGRARIDGCDVLGGKEADFAPLRARMGMLFQGAALFDSLPVWENIFFAPLQEKKITRAKARALAEEKLTAVGLASQVADLYPAELSGGMQRRVGLARAVVTQPEIIFFDEPTAGLDPIISGVINDLIVTNVKELGATAITITHDMNSARKVADTIAMLHEGRIIWCGPAKDLDHSGNDFVDQFIHGRTEGPITVERT
ncbi:MAG: ATP-binding cassette domain-containing protein [Proteobacteria bacterium]|nr:ATP-binding cassette domain-containing protein [Pseudomonadota bacterium]